MAVCNICKECMDEEEGFYVCEDKFNPWTGHSTDDYFICNECDKR